jgi:hypothetical protein
MNWNEPFYLLSDIRRIAPLYGKFLEGQLKRHQLVAERVPFLPGRPYAISPAALKTVLPHWAPPADLAKTQHSILTATVSPRPADAPLAPSTKGWFRFLPFRVRG